MKFLFVRRISLGLLILTGTLGGATVAGTNLTAKQAEGEANAIITPGNLRDYLTFIASDALQGRDTPSPGLDSAAEFIAYQLKKMGAKPAGDGGTYFQHFGLYRRTYDMTKCSVKMGNQSVEGSQFLIFRFGNVSAPAVFVGDTPSPGQDFTGKIVVLSRLGAAFRPGVLKGAVGVVANSGYSGDSFAGFNKGFGFAMGGYKLDTDAAGTTSTEIPTVILDEAVFKKMVGEAKVGDLLPEPVKIEMTSTISRAVTQNVVAIFEGSDPKLKSEYVALGAHYDHLGIDLNKTGDQIYNGADDDGSGTVSILSIAQAVASGPRPSRSLLFVWHAGEEKGLWGSQYFTDHPTVPISSIVAQLNIDMIGRTRRMGDTNKKNEGLVPSNSIYVIGTTMMSTRLGEIVHNTNKSYLKLAYDSRYDDPKDRNKFFYRSDHFNYAKKGIPICFWFDGVHEDYHQVSDEVSKIDFINMSKVARTIFLTAVNVANEPKRPAVDKPLNR